MIKSAYFRVYLPAERSGSWRAHVAARDVVRADDHFVWDEPVGDDAFTTVWDGRSFVCPRNARLRMLEGVLAFNHANPGSALLSEAAIRAASRQLEKLRVSEPGSRSYILTSPWHVPLRWFSAFRDSERELYEGPRGLSIRYRTLVGDAVERVRRAVEAVETAGFDDGIVAQVEDLSRWLADFPYDGLAELDYATVAQLFPDGELAIDESAAHVQRSLEALMRGKMLEAGEAYASVAGHWSQAQSLTYVN